MDVCAAAVKQRCCRQSTLKDMVLSRAPRKKIFVVGLEHGLYKLGLEKSQVKLD